MLGWVRSEPAPPTGAPQPIRLGDDPSPDFALKTLSNGERERAAVGALEELFGVQMNWIAGVSVGLAAAMLLFVAAIAVRNPVMFKTGLRNIPRRPAQTILIVVGLMLSTLIVTAAFGTGDTISTSITADIYRTLGEADEIIEWDPQKQAAPLEDQVIPLDTVDRWRAAAATNPSIEALVPFLAEQLPVLNLETRLNEPLAQLVAFRAEDARALGGLRDLSGKPVELEEGDIAVNQKLADLVDAEVGHQIVLFFGGLPTELEVVAVVPNEVLGGTFMLEHKQGAAVDFDVLASLTGKRDVADAVLVSNTGDVRGGVDHTDDAVEFLESLVGDDPYEIEPTKQDGIEAAKLFGSLFTSFFVVLGLFSIAAGILLIFLIFTMLAAERQPEMGIARAVGAKRRQIVEAFLAEGMGYDLGSALIGVVAGVGATAAMVALLREFVGDESGLNIQLSITGRSLIVSFCLGLLATFLVIFIASWRASRLNIVSAIRGLPDVKVSNPEDATGLGYLRAALNGTVVLALPLGLVLILLGPVGLVFGLPAVVVGAVSPWLYVMRGSDFAASARAQSGHGVPRWPLSMVLSLLGFAGALAVLGGLVRAIDGEWPVFVAVSLVLAAVAILVAIGFGLAALALRVGRDRRPDKVPGWLLVLAVIVSPIGFVLAVLQAAKAQISWTAGLSFALGLGGAVLVVVGMDLDQQFPFAFGISLIFLLIAATLRYFHVAERGAFTICSAALLGFWYATPAGVFEPIVGELNGNIEMFFLSGFAMVAAGTFIVIYNADVILPIIGSAGSRLGRVVPAIKTGIAYPLSSRFRTGMTVAMIGLITFALVVTASLNHNFIRLFLNEDSRGGWDVRLIVNGNNQIDDLVGLLSGLPEASRIDAVGEVRLAFPFEAQVGNIGGYEDADGEVTEFLRYIILGVDDEFINTSDIKLKARARGFETDEEVWARLSDDSDVAVIPAGLTASEGGFGGDPELRDLLRLDSIEDSFEPFTLALREPGGAIREVSVIGQMKESVDQFWFGIMVQRDTLIEAFPESSGQQFFLALDGSSDSEEFAKVLESALLQASVESLQEILDEQARAATTFMLVFQGFMGLGLIVGIAALAVVAFRSVVERRQQIGMLRAIGYKRRMVAASFVFESGFTALAGILMGLVLGLSLAWVLFTSGAVGEETKGNGFVVPWLQLLAITGGAFAVSIVMTIIPARQASGIPVAEALRYE